MEWYYAINGQRLGPVPQAEFERLVQTGTITPATLVWRQGMAEWQPCAAVSGAAGGAAPMGGGGAGGGFAGGATGVDDGTEVCAVSGRRYPRREMIQYEGRWVSAEHRDEFFQRIREGMVQQGEMVYAGFWWRLLAKIIDGLALGLASMPVNMVLGFVMFGSMATPTVEFSGPEPSDALMRFALYQLVSMSVNTGLGLAYALFFIRRYDATPGKLALGLRLLRADGSKLSKARIVGRYFAELLSGIIFCIGYIMAAFDDEKRALHDRICDTRVIKIR